MVFLYGGYSPSPNKGVRHYTDAGSRVATAGRPRTKALVDLIKRERESEDQRLFYVALTRARRRLYLPFSGEGESDAPIEGGTAQEINWKLSGGYSHVNRRLRALRADEAQRRHFEVRDVPNRSARLGRRRPARGSRCWGSSAGARSVEKPSAAKPARKGGLEDDGHDDRARPEAELAQLRRHRVGPTLTSYSRIKQSEGGYRPPTEIHDETNDAPPLADDDLPGGARAGVFVHDLLERVPLETLRATAGFEDWVARDDVRALLEATLAPARARSAATPGRRAPGPRRPHHAASRRRRRPPWAGPRRARGARDGVSLPLPRGGRRGRPRLCQRVRRPAVRARGARLLRRLEDRSPPQLGRGGRRGPRRQELRAAGAALRAGAGPHARHRQRGRLRGALRRDALPVRARAAGRASAAAGHRSPSSPPGARRSPADSARRRRRERGRATAGLPPGQRRWPAATSTGRRSIWRWRPPAGRARFRRPSAARSRCWSSPRARREPRGRPAWRCKLAPEPASTRGSNGWAPPDADRAAVADLVGRLASHPVLEPLVGRLGDHRPFILDGGCLYQERDLRLEERLADALAARIATSRCARWRTPQPRWRRPLPRTVAGRPRRAPPSQRRSRGR